MDKNTKKNKYGQPALRARDILGALGVFAGIAVVILLAIFVLDPLVQYRSAGKLAKAGNALQAIDMYEALGDFLHSAEKAAALQNSAARESVQNGDISGALAAAGNDTETIRALAAEFPEAFFTYANGLAEAGSNEDALTIYELLDGVDGLEEQRDIAYLQTALQRMESGNYEEALAYFDKAGSLDWFLTLKTADAIADAKKIAEFSYARAYKVYALLADKSSTAASVTEQLSVFLPFCGEKKCLSAEGSSTEVQGKTAVFDFIALDDTEYLSCGSDGFFKKTEITDDTGTLRVVYTGESAEETTGVVASYTFALLEDGSILQKYTSTLTGEIVDEYTLLWG